MRGEKFRTGRKPEANYYHVERAYGSFVRTLQLPVNVTEERVNAPFKNGLLTITLMKLPEAVGTTTPIRSV